MSITTVEMLVKAHEPQNEKGTQRKDIITVQAAPHPWGPGDMTGNVVIKMDLDLPYGSDCMTSRRCSTCEYQGINWADEALKEGSTGVPRITCPKEKYISIDGEFIFHLNVNGMPSVSLNMAKKRAYNLEYRAQLTLEDQLKIETDITQISNTERDDRLTSMRSVKVNESEVKQKTAVVIL